MSRNIIVRIKRCKQVILLLLCTGILAFSGCTPASENLQPLQKYKTLIDFQYDLVDIKQDEKVIVVKQDGLYGLRKSERIVGTENTDPVYPYILPAEHCRLSG